MFRFFHEQNLYQNPKLIHLFATIIHPWSKKTCISFLWILFWYPPLFFASLANSGLIFSLFLYLMKYATPIFFLFTTGKLISYQYLFNIYVTYIDCLFGAMRVQSQHHQISRIPYLSLLYHASATSFTILREELFFIGFKK